jgi:hypothetical protein
MFLRNLDDVDVALRRGRERWRERTRLHGNEASDFFSNHRDQREAIPEVEMPSRRFA